MALRVYRGLAPTIVQQWTYKVTDITNVHTYIFTATDGNTNATEAETYTNGASETLITVAAGIAALLTASSNPLMQQLQVTSNGVDTVTISALNGGVPFALVLSGTNTSTTKTIIKSNSGPYDFNCPANYDGNVIPGSGDDIVFVGNATVRYNLYQAGTTFGKLSTGPDFVGSVGYIGAKFQGGATDLDVFGAGQSHWDVAASAITPYVWGTAQLPAGSYACSIKGSALTNVTHKAGSLMIAPMQGETSTVTLVKQYGGTLLMGSGLTLTNFQLMNGTATMLCAASGTVDAVMGKLLIEGSGTIATLNVYDAIVTSNTTGTITAASTKGAGTLDFTQSRAARTVTTMNIAGPTRYDTAVMTFTTKNVYNASGDTATYVPPQS